MGHPELLNIGNSDVDHGRHFQTMKPSPDIIKQYNPLELNREGLLRRTCLCGQAARRQAVKKLYVENTG